MAGVPHGTCKPAAVEWALSNCRANEAGLVLDQLLHRMPKYPSLGMKERESGPLENLLRGCDVWRQVKKKKKNGDDYSFLRGSRKVEEG